jgi:serine O-acetyltransferase
MMFTKLHEDIAAILARDPAARNSVEVLLCYPGMHALWVHRISHFLWTHHAKLLARMLSHAARRRTGVEIHPGAVIGRRVVIDHGMGVVIGETARIEDDVLIYSGVVIGSTSHRHSIRHPTIGRNVLIGANAVLLGPIHIGQRAKIGAGAILREDVPPGAIVGVVARPEQGERVPIRDLAAIPAR